MPFVKLDSAGKVPLPRWMRERMGIRPGDEVELRFTRDGRLIVDIAKRVGHVRLAGEPERSVSRPINVQVRFEPDD